MSNNSLRNRIKESVKTTLEGSSIHAIPNIVRAEFISVKIFWFVCFLASSGCLGYFMSLTISDYLTWPVITNIKINHVQQLTFPIVTICNLNGFKSLDNVIKSCSFSQKPCTREEDFEEVEII